MIAFNCYKNLKTIIGMKRGENGKVKKFHVTTETGKYTLYLSRPRKFCCSHIVTTTIMIQQTKRRLNILLNFNCKNKNIIFLMEYVLYKIQLSVREAEFRFNIKRLLESYKETWLKTNFKKVSATRKVLINTWNSSSLTN